jgi:signal transduction histidine kinase
MLTRRLDLRMLAPTLLVSFILVLVCFFGVRYLNSLHIDISVVLAENVQSTQAATRLETTTNELIRLLTTSPSGHPARDAQIVAQNHVARDLLQQVENLANLDQEKELVPKIANGLDQYLRGWDGRPSVPEDRRARYDADLAETLRREVLLPCIALRRFNTDAIEDAERHNRTIVQRLRWVLFAVGVGAPLSGLVLGYVMARGLHHSMYQLSVRIRDAAGRLNRELASVTLEEHNDLQALNGQMQRVLVDIERVVEQLQQREREVLRAEQLAAVGQVAAGIAHELRNPLTSVKMLVQTGLEGDAPRGLPADDLGIIEHEVRRMEQCIQTFLDLARPPRSERRRTDLAGVLRRSLVLVEGRARRQNVTVDVDAGTEPLYLEIDPEQIHQVVVNLLLNALDALPRGGRVTLSAARAPGGKEVEVRVQDNGPGVAPRIKERLFEPFVSSKETGLGLGLSICKRLIEAHGGSIRGENPRGGGALFTFTLPT